MKIKLATVTLLIFFNISVWATSIENVSFLSGCWSGTVDGRTVTETWSKPSENLLQAIVQMRDPNNKVVEFEFLKIEKLIDGNLSFTPYINGQQVPDFLYNESLSKDSNANKAVFTNAKNDFPKFISYCRQKKDQTVLNIRLEGITEKNEPRVIEFSLRKTSCDINL